MANTHFRPKVPSRFGANPTFVSGAVAATANTTVNTLVPVPKTKCFVSKVTITLSTIGSDSDGTILLTPQIVATDGSTARDLASAVSLELNGVATALVPVAVTITATDGNRVLQEGETLRLKVVNNSAAIDTAPVGYVSFDLLVQE